MSIRPIYGVYYICCIGNYEEVVKEQLTLLETSGLFEKTIKLICFICNYGQEQYLNKSFNELFDKFRSKIEFVVTDKNLYEKYAINSYKKYITHDEYYIYYFHTKGVSKSHIPQFQSQRKMLNFYTITKHEICLRILQNYDVVGAVLYKLPKRHFAGNFWWSKSENTNKLGDVGNNYLAPEMYICANPSTKCVGLTNKTNKYPALCSQDINLDEETSLSDVEILKNSSNREINNPWGTVAAHIC